MKKLPFLALFAVLTLTSSYFSTVISATTPTQTVALNSSFDYFRIHRQANSVALSWATSTTDATQFVVERSFDGEFYEAINQMAFNGAGAYKFKDDSVYPGVIYYRITAVKADGSSEQSTIESIRIVQRN
jgi:hypothetical protein